MSQQENSLNLNLYVLVDKTTLRPSMDHPEESREGARELKRSQANPERYRIAKLSFSEFVR